MFDSDYMLGYFFGLLVGTFILAPALKTLKGTIVRRVIEKHEKSKV